MEAYVIGGVFLALIFFFIGVITIYAAFYDKWK